VQTTDDFILQIGAAQVRVPAEAAARAYLEKLINQPFSDTLPRRLHGATLPEIGEPCKGGIYAGLTIDNNKPMALVLLPGESDELKWKPANDWAVTVGGELPSRIDGLVLFQNLKAEFKPEYYWTAVPYAGNDAYAWYQSFNDGNQPRGHKSNEVRARAVRRFVIESFTPSIA